MSALDEALKKFMENPEEGQEAYYEEILNTNFYIPLSEAPKGDNPEEVSPMVLEAEDKNYLMLFDSEERLKAWADQDVPYAIYAGFQLAEMTPDIFHWAVNVGAQHSKEFIPEEIGWLRESVQAFREEKSE